ncbi:UNVERIFIED_CONTAM: hypothetical protein FKN15_025346 [Acipenser sinensis]
MEMAAALPPLALGHAAPPSLALENAAPPSLALGHAAPPSLALGHKAPPSLAVGHTSPPSLALGHAAPPSLAHGHAAPPSLALGQTAPPSLALGHTAPPSLALRHAAPPSLALRHTAPPSLALRSPFRPVRAVERRNRQSHGAQRHQPRRGALWQSRIGQRRLPALPNGSGTERTKGGVARGSVPSSKCCIGGETEEQKSQRQRDAPSRILKEDLHRQDVNLHSTDRVTHPADVNLHSPDRVAHPADVNLHSPDRVTHPVDVNLHAPDRVAHPADVNLHSPDCVTHPADVNLHSPDRVTHPAHFYQASHSGTPNTFLISLCNYIYGAKRFTPKYIVTMHNNIVMMCKPTCTYSVTTMDPRLSGFLRSHKPIGVFLHPGTREQMSAGYQPLEDKDQPSKPLPPSSLGTWPVGIAAEWLGETV